MSFLVYCLLFILCLHGCNSRVIRVKDNDLYDPKYQMIGKGLEHAHVETGTLQKTSTPSKSSPLLSQENEDIQGNQPTSSHRLLIMQLAAKFEEWKRQSRRILLGPKLNKTEDTVDSKESDGVVEDIVVMDYAQPHRKTPIHNREP